jgi:hypothetical protein
MSCGLAGGPLVLESAIGDRLEAADVTLNSGGEATFIRGEAQDRCGVAGTLWAERLAHVAFPFPNDCRELT